MKLDTILIILLFVFGIGMLISSYLMAEETRRCKSIEREYLRIRNQDTKVTNIIKV